MPTMPIGPERDEQPLLLPADPAPLSGSDSEAESVSVLVTPTRASFSDEEVAHDQEIVDRLKAMAQEEAVDEQEWEEEYDSDSISHNIQSSDDDIISLTEERKMAIKHSSTSVIQDFSESEQMQSTKHMSSEHTGTNSPEQPGDITTDTHGEEKIEKKSKVTQSSNLSTAPAKRDYSSTDVPNMFNIVLTKCEWDIKPQPSKDEQLRLKRSHTNVLEEKFKQTNKGCPRF